jgi:hypothetical protein
MKPKPFESLNHLTVPVVVAIIFITYLNMSINSLNMRPNSLEVTLLLMKNRSSY